MTKLFSIRNLLAGKLSAGINLFSRRAGVHKKVIPAVAPALLRQFFSMDKVQLFWLKTTNIKGISPIGETCKTNELQT
jgi:hypothetical protein